MHLTYKCCYFFDADAKISFSCSSKGRHIHSIVGRGHQSRNNEASDIIWSVNTVYSCIKA